MSRAPLPLLTVVVSLLPASALAQSITTTPVAPVSVVGPWMMIALALVVLGTGYTMLRARAGHDAGARFAALMIVAALGAAVALHAQAALTFTAPDGETLSIPITPETSGDDVDGWEPADFTNGTSVPLWIASIDEPTFSECFPGGLDGVLTSGASDPSPHPLCAVNAALAAGATCRVDVETICRAAAAGNLATLTTVAPDSGPAAGGTLVTLTGANLTGATSVTFDGVAATGVTVVDDTTVTATTPGHALGVVDVVITTPAGRATLDDGFAFTMTLTSVSANSGSASGGVGVTLSGASLDATTGVTFGGVPATSVNVISSTTVTAVTPAHAAGAVDIEVTGAGVGATLAGGFTYLATAVGQSAHGGIIANLEGGLYDLIAASADNSAGIAWGGSGTEIGSFSAGDGAANTAMIVAELTGNQSLPLTSYAAGVCSAYEADSQGNTPCQPGNTCYDDWFLPSSRTNFPALGQLRKLYDNRVAIGGFAAAGYWGSSESPGFGTFQAWRWDFTTGIEGTLPKTSLLRVRCVRTFTP